MICDEYEDALDSFKVAKKEILATSKSKGKETVCFYYLFCKLFYCSVFFA